MVDWVPIVTVAITTFSSVGIVWYKAGQVTKGQESIRDSLKTHTDSDNEQFGKINDSLTKVRESVARIEGSLNVK